MGRPMVRNLLRAGHDVIVHNRSPEPARTLAAEGARTADDPREVAAGATHTALCVADPDAVRAVALDSDGLLAGAPAGGVIVDHSTIDPETTRVLAETASARDVAWVDAPVSGGEQGAIDGTLTMMAGGDPAAVTAVRPMLEVNGATVRHVGPVGTGQTVKAANQLLVGGTLALVAEAVLLLEAAGAEVTPALEALAGGLAGSAVLDAKGARMHAREFAPGARVDLHRKDLGIALEIAREHTRPVPLTGLVAQLFDAAAARGHGGDDHAGVLRALEALGPPGGTDAEPQASAAPTSNASRNRPTAT
ncbi:NAD(P)-dependent oxidoreductase [Egibacter rhizosphaerae]|uniref:NAD(P)-dependent oxidoreductase n=2 Tax=Egibacter rhizosphaerae TaxID=1670831 RepID=A0A411YLE3_9ACTN|nr:NAD(P)-dependent oxidoreductase [Egibacter rhizosphaerae]